MQRLVSNKDSYSTTMDSPCPHHRQQQRQQVYGSNGNGVGLCASSSSSSNAAAAGLSSSSSTLLFQTTTTTTGRIVKMVMSALVVLTALFVLWIDKTQVGFLAGPDADAAGGGGTTIIRTAKGGRGLIPPDGNTGALFRGEVVRTYAGQRRFSSRRGTDIGARRQDELRGRRSPATTPVTIAKADAAFSVSSDAVTMCDRWAVVTTIFVPSPGIEMVVNLLLPDWCLVIVGDTKTPDEAYHRFIQNMTTTDNDDNDKRRARRRTIVFLSAAQQQKDFFQNKHCEFCQQMPWKSFARKNIGYLYAIQHGAKAIFDFDDDNVLQNFTKNSEIVDSVSSSQEDQSQQPFSPFSMLLDASSSIHVRFLRDENPGVASTNATTTTTSRKGRPFNPFPLMYPSEAEVWPRGFPLSEIKDPFLSGQHPRTTMYEGKLPLSNVAVLQSVCDGDPDVDAIYRLTRPLPVHFDTTVSPLLVPSLSYVPYNAQATIHLEQAFWALLLPFTVAGRVTDIWRSYFSERLFHELGLSVVYTPPMVTHNRNAHEYMADWEAEHDLYHKTSALLTFLNEWQPDGDVKNSKYLPVHLEELWIALYERDYIGLQDVSSMQHWLAALEGIGYVFPSLRRETPGTLSKHGVDDAIIESHPSKLLAFPKVEAPVRKKKWAVLMIGGARTYAVCRESITKNVLLQTDPPMDMFTYSFHHQNQSCHLDNLGLDILDRDSKMIHYDDAFVKYEATSREASYDRFVRQQVEHFQMLQQYQTKHNVTYDYVLYARPDLFFLEPFDFQAIEKILDEPRTNGTYAMFSPACCQFRGICDRIAATTYEGYSNMMRLTEAWHENATHLIGEEAFGERAAFAKMERFDVVGAPHAFATVRNSNVGKICQGTEDIGASWTDYVCFARGQSSFLPLLQQELRPSTCAIYNSSNCPDR